MQIVKIAALLCLMATGSAFAQSNPSTTNTAAGATGSPSTTAQQAGQWVPPDGQAIAPKTRAQVYGELVEAEKDGQLAYLNSTVYAHP